MVNRDPDIDYRQKGLPGRIQLRLEFLRAPVLISLLDLIGAKNILGLAPGKTLGG